MLYKIAKNIVATNDIIIEVAKEIINKMKNSEKRKILESEYILDLQGDKLLTKALGRDSKIAEKRALEKAVMNLV